VKWCDDVARVTGRGRRWSIAGRRGACALLCAGLLVFPGPAKGQDPRPPNRGGFTQSMGVPPSWRYFVGLTAAFHQRDQPQAAFYGYGGFYRDLVNPMTSALGISGEGYFGSRGSFSTAENGFDAGVRLGLLSPITRLGFGWDYNLRDAETDFYLSFVHPLRRGGIIKGGGAFRVDYWPGRDHSFGLGVRLPVGQRFLGRTRARDSRVRLEDPEPPDQVALASEDLVEALTRARDHAHWVNRLTVPYTDHWHAEYDRAMERFVLEMEVIRAHIAASADGTLGGPIEEVRALHYELDRAFSIATSARSLAPGWDGCCGDRPSHRARACAYPLRPAPRPEKITGFDPWLRYFGFSGIL